MRGLNRVFGLLTAFGLLLVGCSSLRSTNAASTAPASSSAESPAGSAATGGHVTLNLVAFSTSQSAYAKLIAAFQQTPTGRNVKFTQSYGAPAAVVRRVLPFLPCVEAIVRCDRNDSQH